MDIFCLRAVTGCLGIGKMVIGPNIRGGGGNRIFSVPPEHLPMAVIKDDKSRSVSFFNMPIRSKTIKFDLRPVFRQPGILPGGRIDCINNPLTGLFVGCTREKRQPAMKLSCCRNG